MFNEFRLNALKEEYIALCFGKMIYDTNTDDERATILEEIELLEKEKTKTKN